MMNKRLKVSGYKPINAFMKTESADRDSRCDFTDPFSPCNHVKNVPIHFPSTQSGRSAIKNAMKTKEREDEISVPAQIAVAFRSRYRSRNSDQASLR